MALAAMMGLTVSVNAGNFNINDHLGTFQGGSTDAVKATVDYDGDGPLPPGTYVIKPRNDDDDWYLPDIVFVEDGATLVIEPGTTIYADADTKGTPDKDDDTYGSIVVARGGKLMAEGTATKPIVITSVAERDGLPLNHPYSPGQQPVAGRDGGLWGGVVLLGRAPLTNRDGANGVLIREAVIEGFAANASDTRVRYGPGANAAQPDDNSGVLSYVSLRFGGYEFSAGSEINGLTMGAVGRGTRIENIEVVSNTDDAFEWFGGTVNCRNLVAVFCNDDNLDIDLGFQGVIQNVLIVQNNVANSQGADNGFELSGVTGSTSTGTGPEATDATRPFMFNVTAIGNGANNSTAMRLNSGFSGQIHNSVFLNYDRGVRLDDTFTAGLVAPTGTLALKNNTWVTPRLTTVASGAAATPAASLYAGIGDSNNEFAAIAELGLRSTSLPSTGRFNPTLEANSPLWARNGATTTKAADVSDLLDSNQLDFLKELPYQGAFGSANWASGWTYLSQKGYFAGENFNINEDLGTFQGGSTDAVKATVDYDGDGPLPAGTYVIKPRNDGKDWYLPDIVFVEDGATLVIEPGTTIYADADNKGTPDKDDDTYGSIVVARGGKLMAEGTATAPIMITSVAERDGLRAGHPFAGQQPVAGRDGGLWGGVVLLGRAPLTNRDGANGVLIREAVIEGFAANASDTRVRYGPGANAAQPDDNSGVLSYVSLRFGGYEFSAGSEINGLTMGAVGRGTRIENIEVVSNTDDAFEWFGGTVNCRNLVAVFCNDDNLDIDLGFQGVIQNVLIVQNNVANSQGADNGFELSGVTGSTSTGTGPEATDATRPFMFNVTAIGNGANNSTAMRLNSGFSGQIHNSVFLNYDRGVRLDDTFTAGLVAPTGTLALKNNTWVTPRLTTVASGAAATPAASLYAGIGDSNNEFAAIQDLALKSNSLPATGRFNPAITGTSPLWEANGATLTTSADMTSLLDQNQLDFLEDLPYQGAFGNSNWAEGWTYLSENGYFSQVVSGDAVAPTISLVGANPLVVRLGQSFTDPGATVTDNVDATRTITGTGTVNTEVAGNYTVSYNAVDAAGNLATTVTRTVIVLSTTANFVTSAGSPLDIANFFRTGAFANATSVTLVGRPLAGMVYVPATRTFTRYPTAAGTATFNVTLPGQAPFTFVMNFAIQPVPASLIGVHTLHTDAGDLVTITVTSTTTSAGASVVVLPPAATRANAAVRGVAKFNPAETNPNRIWTIDIPAIQLSASLPALRSLKESDGSHLGNYGTIAGKTLWGYKRNNTTGTLVLRKGSLDVTCIGTIGANGAIAWRLTPAGARSAITYSGTLSTDGIANVRAIIPNAGLLMGMLRVDEELDNEGTPTGQLSMSLLQGFDGWEPVSYNP